MKGKILSLIAAVFFCMPLAGVHAETPTAASLHTITVQGQGSLDATPDRAGIAIGVVTYDEYASQAQQKNAAALQAVMEKLQALGIDAKNMQTRNFNFYPVYNNEGKRSNEIQGYTVENDLYVIVDDTSLLGSVIDSALSSGANKINSVDFSLQNPENLQQKALAAAFLNAQEKANALADAAGKRIVQVLSISENHTGIQSRQLDNMFLAKSAGSRTPIAAGRLNIDASVQVEFILE